MRAIEVAGAMVGSFFFFGGAVGGAVGVVVVVGFTC